MNDPKKYTVSWFYSHENVSDEITEVIREMAWKVGLKEDEPLFAFSKNSVEHNLISKWYPHEFNDDRILITTSKHPFDEQLFQGAGI